MAQVKYIANIIQDRLDFILSTYPERIEKLEKEELEACAKVKALEMTHPRDRIHKAFFFHVVKRPLSIQEWAQNVNADPEIQKAKSIRRNIWVLKDELKDSLRYASRINKLLDQKAHDGWVELNHAEALIFQDL